MKYLLTTILCLYFLSASSQTTYTFSINSDEYSLDQRKLNDLFGVVFNKLVQAGKTKEQSLDLWVKSFDVFKELAADGRYTWEVYNDRIVNFKFTPGIKEYTEEDLGLKKGKSVRENTNKASSHSSRMAYLNGLLVKEITISVTKKQIL